MSFWKETVLQNRQFIGISLCTFFAEKRDEIQSLESWRSYKQTFLLLQSSAFFLQRRFHQSYSKLFLPIMSKTKKVWQSLFSDRQMTLVVNTMMISAQQIWYRRNVDGIYWTDLITVWKKWLLARNMSHRVLSDKPRLRFELLLGVRPRSRMKIEKLKKSLIK